MITKHPDNISFRDISIDHYSPTYGDYGYQRATCDQCRAEATHILTRTSNISDNRYSQLLCSRHAQPTP